MSVSIWEQWSHDTWPLGRIILGRNGVLQIKKINKGRKIRQSILLSQGRAFCNFMENSPRRRQQVHWDSFVGTGRRLQSSGSLLS